MCRNVELTSCLMTLWTVHLPIQQEQEQGILFSNTLTDRWIDQDSVCH